MDIRKRLIIELSKEDNMPFLLELNGLLPEVFTEFRMRLFETKLLFPAGWEDYEVRRGKEECIHFTRAAFAGEGFFRFSIYVGNDDSNMYYGIVGPWDKASTIAQVQDLKKQILDSGFEGWRDWMFRHFLSTRQSLFDSIAHDQDVGIAFIPFREELLASWIPLKDLLEKANRFLLGSRA